MRGKVAKKLRRMAESATVGMPEVDYVVSNWGECVVKNEVGDVTGRATKCTASRVARCTRSEYQRLKRQYKRGNPDVVYMVPCG